MNTKVNEGKLISGKEALIALANGESVQCANAVTLNWSDVDGDCHIDLFTTAKNRNGFDSVFRLKPRTITLNGIEVPTPFEPKEEDQYWYLDSSDPQGYNTDIRNHEEMFSQFKKTAFCQIGLWRTEEEIKQVVAALRQVFGGSHDN